MNCTCHSNFGMEESVPTARRALRHRCGPFQRLHASGWCHRWLLREASVMTGGINPERAIHIWHRMEMESSPGTPFVYRKACAKLAVSACVGRYSRDKRLAWHIDGPLNFCNPHFFCTATIHGRNGCARKVLLFAEIAGWISYSTPHAKLAQW